MISNYRRKRDEQEIKTVMSIFQSDDFVLYNSNGKCC